MTSTGSDSAAAGDQAIRDRVVRAIAENRSPGLHFPGHFLGIEYTKIGNDIAEARLPDGLHCRNADGTISMVALAVLADNALGASARTRTKPGVRLGTTYLHLQFTGAAMVGDIEASMRFLGYRDGASLQQSLTAGTLQAQGKPVCYAGGEFLLLDPPSGVTLGPLPWEGPGPRAASPIGMEMLEPHERGILAVCDAALAKASPHSAFVEHFWGGLPRRGLLGAGNRVAVGPHIGNRVGHVQGGILLGLAATTACAAAPATMMLSNVSAWYISPGRGAELRIGSRIVHAGRATAVVRTEIRTTGGERVIEAVSHHVAREQENR